jgi:hypothetical protein
MIGRSLGTLNNKHWTEPFASWRVSGNELLLGAIHHLRINTFCFIKAAIFFFIAETTLSFKSNSFVATCSSKSQTNLRPERNSFFLLRQLSVSKSAALVEPLVHLKHLN